MAVIQLVSATGAPGVTTTALGLLSAWPADAVLVDLDRDGGQAILAGHLGGQDGAGRGMQSVAAAHRERREISLRDQTFRLFEDAPSTLR